MDFRVARYLSRPSLSTARSPEDAIAQRPAIPHATHRSASRRDHDDWRPDDGKREFFDLRRSRFAVETQSRHPYPYYVIEFKANWKDVTLLSNCIRDFPLSVTRNSKYLIGASSLIRVPYI